MYRENDKPTRELTDGTREWWKSAQQKPYIDIIDSNGYMPLQRDKIRHRENGPAVVFTDGTEEWWYEDNLHRRDGPAIV
jgi:hypothetical protein